MPEGQFDPHGPRDRCYSPDCEDWHGPYDRLREALSRATEYLNFVVNVDLKQFPAAVEVRDYGRTVLGGTTSEVKVHPELGDKNADSTRHE